MGKGRFVNQKLGKRVHRGINQHLLKSKTQNWPQENKRRPNPPQNAAEFADDDKQADSSDNAKGR
jgi:hypothetical protein